MTLPEKEALEVLKPYLGEELAKAIIEFRSVTKKAKLTAYAAKLLLKEYAKTSDIIAAAEMQIAMSWQGFSASWYFNEIAKQGHKAQNNGRRTAADAARDYNSRIDYSDAPLGLPLPARH